MTKIGLRPTLYGIEVINFDDRGCKLAQAEYRLFIVLSAVADSDGSFRLGCNDLNKILAIILFLILLVDIDIIKKIFFLANGNNSE